MKASEIREGTKFTFSPYYHNYIFGPYADYDHLKGYVFTIERIERSYNGKISAFYKYPYGGGHITAYSKPSYMTAAKPKKIIILKDSNVAK